MTIMKKSLLMAIEKIKKAGSFSCHSFFLCFLLVLEIRASASCILGKSFNAEIYTNLLLNLYRAREEF